MLKGLKILISITVLLFFSDTYLLAYSQEINNELIAVKKQRIKEERLEKFLLRKNVYFKNQIINNGLDLSFITLKLGGGEDPQSTANELRKTGLFEFIEPNYELTSDYNIISIPTKKIIPDDENFKRQYYLNQTKVTNAWLLSRGSTNVTIAVLDSGIDYSNLDLLERVLPCTNYIEDSFSCQDDFGHGTKVVSIIGAKTDNKLALAGISWLNPILPIKVSDNKGIATVSTVVKGLDYALKNGAKIAVISLSTEKESKALKQATEAASQKGILIIASGGNSGIEEIRYPAGYDGVVGVGSVNLHNEKSSFSTTGSHIKIVSPGEKIFVPSLGTSSIEEVSGTSFSAPQVAGIAALVWALRPTYSNNDIQKLLLTTAQDLGDAGYDSNFGYGLVDAEVAIKRAILKYEKY